MGLFDADKSATRLPVSLITGFLGSGKTTLLNKLLRHPGMGDSAVIINEFGEVGLDHLLVEAIDGEVADDGKLRKGLEPDGLIEMIEQRRACHARFAIDDHGAGAAHLF